MRFPSAPSVYTLPPSTTGVHRGPAGYEIVYFTGYSCFHISLPVAASRHSTRSMPVNSLRSKLSTFTLSLGHVVGDEHLAVGHRRTRIAARHRHAPHDLRPAFRKLLQSPSSRHTLSRFGPIHCGQSSAVGTRTTSTRRRPRLRIANAGMAVTSNGIAKDYASTSARRLNEIPPPIIGLIARTQRRDGANKL